MNKVLDVAVLILILFLLLNMLNGTSSNQGNQNTISGNYNYVPTYAPDETQCREIKALCNEALGEYASYKAQEETYTKYESNKKLYDELIRRYEEEIFPQCKKRLNECK